MEVLGILWLKLDGTSRANLKSRYPAQYENSYYDHVTLAFGANKRDVALHIGTTANATVYAYAQNPRIEAVRVRTDNLPDTYGTPHITLSAANGVPPFESVAMLKADHFEEAIESPFEITGTVEFIPF